MYTRVHKIRDKLIEMYYIIEKSNKSYDFINKSYDGTEGVMSEIMVWMYMQYYNR